MKSLISLAILLVLNTAAFAVPNTFQSGDVITAQKMNANFTAVDTKANQNVERHNATDSRLDSIDTSIDIIETAINTINDAGDEGRMALTAVENLANTNASDITAVEGDVTTLEGSVNSLSSSVASNSSYLTDLDEGLGSVDQRLSTVENQLTPPEPFLLEVTANSLDNCTTTVQNSNLSSIMSNRSFTVSELNSIKTSVTPFFYDTTTANWGWFNIGTTDQQALTFEVAKLSELTPDNDINTVLRKSGNSWISRNVSNDTTAGRTYKLYMNNDSIAYTRKYIKPVAMNSNMHVDAWGKDFEGYLVIADTNIDSTTYVIRVVISQLPVIQQANQTNDRMFHNISSITLNDVVHINPFTRRDIFDTACFYVQ